MGLLPRLRCGDRPAIAITCCALALGIFSEGPATRAEAPSATESLPEAENGPAAACPPGNIAADLELAARAERRGLLDRAEDAYRRVLDGSPLHQGARRALIRLAEGRPLPRTSQAYEQARADLPERFIEFETKRFIVLSDADWQWTRAQAQRLERTHHQFQRFARRLRLEPLPLRHKLVCILFADRAEYQHFAGAHDDVADPWIAGYYSPVHDRVVFYQGEANPSVVEARSKLRQMGTDIDSIARQAEHAMRQGQRENAAVLRQHRQRYREHLLRERRRVDAFAEQISIATTVHETTHQLLFHTRIQTPRLQYPIWISEGLATAFETDDTGGAFGPDHEYAPRREAFEELLGDDGLIDLRDLVTWTRLATTDEQTVHAVYQQSYALVTWLNRCRAGQLSRYLQLMLVEPPASLGPDRYRTLFEEAFGDIDRLQHAWLGYERSRLEP